MEKNEAMKAVFENTAELKSTMASLEKRYDVLETEKIARMDADYLATQKELSELRTALNRSGDQKEAEVKGHEMKSLFLKGLRGGFDKLSEAETKQLQITGAGNGAATIPKQIADAITADRDKWSAIRQVANVYTTSTNGLTIPVQDGFAAASYKSETSTRSTTATPSIQEVDIAVTELSAYPMATLDVLDDAAFPLEAWLIAQVGNSLATAEGTKFINGSGTNEPSGILTVASTSASAYNNVHAVASAANTGLQTNDILNLVYNLAPAYRQNASFVGSDSFMLATRKLSNVQGDYLWQDQLALDVPPTLLGKPVFTDENLAAVAAGAAGVAIFGDFKNGYTIVDRMGMSLVRDIYTAPGYVKFFVRMRNGGAVTQGKALRTLNIIA